MDPLRPLGHGGEKTKIFNLNEYNAQSRHDAACLAAAVEAEAILITADARFTEKMRHTKAIRLLNGLCLRRPGRC